MFVPILSEGELVDQDGKPSQTWENTMIQLLQNMQEALSNEGFEIPSVSSEVIPPATQSNLTIIQNSFGQPNGAIASTLIFDPYEVNGATLPARNGQLKVLLNDGTFHNITNT